LDQGLAVAAAEFSDLRRAAVMRIMIKDMWMQGGV
jgi:hypothetical protein